MSCVFPASAGTVTMWTGYSHIPRQMVSRRISWLLHFHLLMEATHLPVVEQHMHVRSKHIINMVPYASEQLSHWCLAYQEIQLQINGVVMWMCKVSFPVERHVQGVEWDKGSILNTKSKRHLEEFTPPESTISRQQQETKTNKQGDGWTREEGKEGELVKLSRRQQSKQVLEWSWLSVTGSDMKRGPWPLLRVGYIILWDEGMRGKEYQLL